MPKQTGGKPFLDTNVLIYAFARDDPRQQIARKLLAEGGAIGVQTVNEFVAVARGKLLRHGYHIFNSLVIAAALEADCNVLYSEDMHDGRVIEGLAIRNPF